jgi:hypothetical protein
MPPVKPASVSAVVDVLAPAESAGVGENCGGEGAADVDSVSSQSSLADAADSDTPPAAGDPDTKAAASGARPAAARPTAAGVALLLVLAATAAATA